MALVLIATLVWSLYEAVLNFWQLEPRLVMPAVLGILLLLPWVRRKLFPLARTANLSLVVATVAVLAFAATRQVGIAGSADFTAHGDRYSPLDQINAGNVQNLQLAWRMRTGEDQGGTDAGHEFNFEDTPIKVDDTVYVCTGHSWVEAIDASTGKLKWKFDPNADTRPDVYLACRGVSYYKAPAGTVTDCPERIIAPVLDARMMALNAQTGQLCRDFGDNGYISLKQYLGNMPAGYHFVTTPPMVVNDRQILRRKSMTNDQPMYEQIKMSIDRRIEAEEWPSDFQIPSEDQLAEEFGVSSLTVRRALRELQAEGVLIRIQGRGTFVVGPRMQCAVFTLSNISEDIAQSGGVHSCQVLAHLTLPPDSPLRSMLPLPAGQDIYHSRLLHIEDGTPIQLEDRFVNAAEAPGYMAQDFTTQPSHSFLVRNTTVTTVDNMIRAVRANEEAQSLLHIDAGQPCLLLDRATWRDGVPVTRSRFLYPGDLYSLRSSHEARPSRITSSLFNVKNR